MAPQTYATHVQRARTWSIGWLLAVVGFVMLLWSAVQAVTLQSVALVLLAAAVVVGLTVSRVFATRLQDRIIRLEMQVRLARLGRADDLERLSLKQLIALRFAGDAELPALIEETVAQALTPDQIKRAVTNWQGDYLRV